MGEMVVQNKFYDGCQRKESGMQGEREVTGSDLAIWALEAPVCFRI